MCSHTYSVEDQASASPVCLLSGQTGHQNKGRSTPPCLSICPIYISLPLCSPSELPLLLGGTSLERLGFFLGHRKGPEILGTQPRLILTLLVAGTSYTPHCSVLHWHRPTNVCSCESLCSPPPHSTPPLCLHIRHVLLSRVTNSSDRTGWVSPTSQPLAPYACPAPYSGLF